MPRFPISDDAFFELPVGLLCVIGFDGRFRRLSRGWTSLLGYSEEELLATPYSKIVHPDDVTASKKALESVIAGEGPAEFENRVRAKDGAYRVLQWQLVLAVGEQAIYGMSWDLTEVRAKETMLSR